MLVAYTQIGPYKYISKKVRVVFYIFNSTVIDCTCFFVMCFKLIDIIILKFWVNTVARLVSSGDTVVRLVSSGDTVNILC